jgi:hypothetical protein
MDRRQIVVAAAASSLPFVTAPSLAQDFPKAGMNIKYVVPFAQ